MTQLWNLSSKAVDRKIFDFFRCFDVIFGHFRAYFQTESKKMASLFKAISYFGNNKKLLNSASI